MDNKGSKIFTVLVVGDNPYELMKQYDINLKVEPYCKYKYLDANKIKENNIKFIQELIARKSDFNLNQTQIDYFKEKINDMKEMSDFEYYQEITQGLKYDEFGNAMSDENPNGKWKTCKIGDFLSIPFVLKDGNHVHQAINKNIDWEKMHLCNTEIYDVTWELIRNNKQPMNEKEKQIKESMVGLDNYFNSFKNKEQYVTHNTAYWNYAFLDQNGWKDVDDYKSHFEWIANYYDNFIKKIPKKSKLTVFECTK